jgi:hypothetical protein
MPLKTRLGVAHAPMAPGARCLISMSTPAGRSSRWSESTVLGRRLDDVDQALVDPHLEVLAESLSTCAASGSRVDVRISVGSGTGPRTFAWCAAPSRRSSSSLLDDLGDAAGADGAATLADGEAQALVHGDRLDELDLISVLSPGMTISTPSGSGDVPVTSVVRK